MLYEMARACLFKMNPETAHSLIMGNIDWVVALGVTKLVTGPEVNDPVEVMGLKKWVRSHLPLSQATLSLVCGASFPPKAL